MLCTGPGAAFAEGDPAVGAAIAEAWCSECHATEATEGGTDMAPGWRSIAADPDKDAAYLAAYLGNPHPAMRHIPLTELDIDDLVAYILALGFE